MVRDVVIVGGGTAGWMTASYLRAAFGDRVSITLVESGTVGTIGVGEATFSTVRHFFEYLGLQERDWMPSCGATYKLAIRFENWRSPGHYFYHPFERLRVVDGFPLAEWWLRTRPTTRSDQACFVTATLCDAKRSPRGLDGRLYDTSVDAMDLDRRSTLSEQDAQFPYAYHFDAVLLAELLMGLATRQGVRRVVDDVLNCRLDERGWIDRVVTREHGDLRGDLFVDCTGFRSMLLGGALGEPFVSYLDTLPNDRAVALRVPADVEREGIRPYTTATAMDAGWIWTIPLQGRNGMGYVYSGEHCAPDEAEAALRAHAGRAADGLEANHIRMRIGRHRASWVANCVAIGLASGFVEPLESTGIFFIQHAIEQLVKHFPDEGWDAGLRGEYNRLMGRCMDGVREFLTLHYRAAARADSAYWRATKEREATPELDERLRLWSRKLPDAESVYPHYHGFEPYSYTAMLMGLGGVPLRHRPALDLVDDRAALRELDAVRRLSERLAVELPGHHEYIGQLGEEARTHVA